MHSSKHWAAAEHGMLDRLVAGHRAAVDLAADYPRINYLIADYSWTSMNLNFCG